MEEDTEVEPVLRGKEVRDQLVMFALDQDAATGSTCPPPLLLYHSHSFAVCSGNDYINKPNGNIT